jgi:hypothetical protein
MKLTTYNHAQVEATIMNNKTVMISIDGFYFQVKDIDETIAFLKDVKRRMKGKPAKTALPNAKTLSPSTQKIWDHLQKVGSISNVEAQAIYRCRALPRRIKDIEEQLGVSISRVMKQDATGQRYTRYSV